MDDDDEEVHSAVSFFSRRAKFVAKVTDEDLDAASDMLSKIQKEKDAQRARTAPKKTSKRTKGTKSASLESDEITLDGIENVEDDLSTVILSAQAKRRLKKLKMDQDFELQQIEEENQRIFSAIQPFELDKVEEVVPDYNFDKINVITVSYMSQISRLTCHNHDKFSTIFPKVAESFKLKASEFLLSHKEQIIKIDDTPNSLNITHSDILECIPYKLDKISEAEAQCRANSLKIIFQSSDSKEKIKLLVHKLEKMKDIMEKYSKLRDIPLNLLIFQFDGENILGDETPEDLDMESGNCIDVRVLAKGEENKKEKGKESEIMTVDSDSDIYID